MILPLSSSRTYNQRSARHAISGPHKCTKPTHAHMRMLRGYGWHVNEWDHKGTIGTSCWIQEQKWTQKQLWTPKLKCVCAVPLSAVSVPLASLAAAVAASDGPAPAAAAVASVLAAAAAWHAAALWLGPVPPTGARK
jgi:hypothetical protein